MNQPTRDHEGRPGKEIGVWLLKYASVISAVAAVATVIVMAVKG